jgi:tetratricopeptide (TPR) repeat protein
VSAQRPVPELTNMRTLPLDFPRLPAAVLIAVLLGGCSSETNKSRVLERAQREFEMAQYDKARIEFLNVLQLDPHNATAIQQLGMIWFEEGAPLKALPFLLRVREITPDNLDARIKLARVFVLLGELAEARKEAIAILERSPVRDDAIILLADTARTPQEIEETERRLEHFTERGRASFHLASASLFIRRSDLASAEGEVRQALALDRKTPAPHLAMSDLFWLRKNFVQAGQELRAAVELSPIRSDSRLKYAEFQANAGALDEAAATLKEITRQAPDYLPAWGCLAKFAYTKQKYDESLAFLENVFNRDPLNLEGRLLQSENWLAQGEVKLALEGLERLNKAYPDVPIAELQLARAYLQNDNPAQAIVTLNRLLTSNPGYLEAILLMGEANLRAGDARPVIASMQSLLIKHPAQAQAQVLLAAAYQSLEQLDDAAAIFRDLISASPENPRSYLGLGLVLRQQGKTAEARTAFEEAEKLEPENMAALQQLVELDILSRDFESAFRRVSRQLEKRPDSADAHLFEGKIYAGQGDWDRAEAALLQTLKLNPGYYTAYDLLIDVYLASDRFTQALDQINALRSKDPDNAHLLMLSGLIYDRLNQFPQAQDAYERLLSLRPDFAPALNNLAYLYAERAKQLDKAYDLARKARALKRDDAAIADTLGWILYKKADFDRALILLKESAAKLPNIAEIRFHLGMAYYMMGQIEAARAALRQAAQAPADFPGKGDLERRMALLGDDSGKLPKLSSDELETILRRDPADIVACLRLGEAYESQRDFSRAAAAYENAVKVNPSLLPAVVKLAKLYTGPLNNRDKAAEFERKARQLAPDDLQAITISEGSSL